MGIEEPFRLKIGHAVNQMAENPNVTLPFCQQNLHDDGQPFSKMAWLLVIIHTSLRVFKVRRYMFSLRKSGWAKTQPTQPLAAAMQVHQDRYSYSHNLSMIV